MLPAVSEELTTRDVS